MGHPPVGDCNSPTPGGYYCFDVPENPGPTCSDLGFNLPGGTNTWGGTYYCSAVGCVCTLDNSYCPAAPTPTPTPTDCTFNGNPVVNGGSVTAYLSDDVPNNQTCQSETRTCTNGTLSGSYAYPACTVAFSMDDDLLP